MTVQCPVCGRYFTGKSLSAEKRMLGHHASTEHEGSERALAKLMQPLEAFI